MRSQDTDLTQHTLRLVKHTKLPQDRPAVVVNSFTGQTVVGVKRVYAAKRKLNLSPCRRKTAPAAEVCAPNHEFNKNGILSHMPALHLDLDVRQCIHQLLVEQTDAVTTGVVLVPRLIIIASRFTECPENALEIVLVLKANMLLNNGDTSGLPVVQIRCVSHVRPSRWSLAEAPATQILSLPEFISYNFTGWCFATQSGSKSTPNPGPVGTLIFPFAIFNVEVLHSYRMFAPTSLNS